MKIVLMGAAKSLKNKIAGILLAIIMLTPVAAFSQEEANPDEGDDPTEITTPSPSSTSTGPWENSAGSGVGTSSAGTANGSTAAAPSTAPRLSRPAAGPTADDRDPNGNPDVPFDDNMNLAFLAAGIVFAGYAIRKRFMLKSIPLTAKNE